MGVWLTEKRGMVSGLAFFPVVAISTNLSTRLSKYKENKNYSVLKHKFKKTTLSSDA